MTNMSGCNQQCMGYMVCSGMEDSSEINCVYNTRSTGNEKYPKSKLIPDI